MPRPPAGGADGAAMPPGGTALPQWLHASMMAAAAASGASGHPPPRMMPQLLQGGNPRNPAAAAAAAAAESAGARHPPPPLGSHSFLSPATLEQARSLHALALAGGWRPPPAGFGGEGPERRGGAFQATTPLFSSSSSPAASASTLMQSQLSAHDPTLQLPVPLPPALAEAAGTLQMLFQGHRLSLARLQSALSTLADVLRCQAPTPVSSATVDVSNALGGHFYPGQSSFPSLYPGAAGGPPMPPHLGGGMPPHHQAAFMAGAGTIPDTSNFQDLAQHDATAAERMMSSDAQLRVVCPVCGGKGRNSERRCVVCEGRSPFVVVAIFTAPFLSEARLAPPDRVMNCVPLYLLANCHGPAQQKIGKQDSSVGKSVLCLLHVSLTEKMYLKKSKPLLNGRRIARPLFSFLIRDQDAPRPVPAQSTPGPRPVTRR